MFFHLASQLGAIFLKERFLRRIDREGDLSAGREIAHLDRPVDQFITDRQLILAIAVITFQQRFSIGVRPFQMDDISSAIEIHAHFRVDAEIDRRIQRLIVHIVIIAKESDHQQHTGRHQAHDGRFPAEMWCGSPLFPHQDRIHDGLSDRIGEVGRFDEPAFLIQQDHISGVTFHYDISHHASTPLFLLIRCVRIIS